MATVVRVVDGGTWAYVPANGVVGSRTERVASSGMADARGAVYLRSESGPVIWPLLRRPAEKRDCKSLVLEAMSDKCIRLGHDERLHFGERDDTLSYNEFLDMSLAVAAVDVGVKVDAKPIEDGQIVMTAWPDDGRLIPALASIPRRRVSLELAEPQEKGKRCFVLNEECSSLITASYESNGGETLRAIAPEALAAWLMFVGSRAMSKAGRYVVEPEGDAGFLIKDRKSGKYYVGDLRFADKDNAALELSRLERVLDAKGIGAVLPSYKLRKRTGDNK
jgi:hypothetical protein